MTQTTSLAAAHACIIELEAHAQTDEAQVERVARAIMDHRLGAGTYDNASLWQGADAEKEETRREARAAIAALQPSVAQAAKVLGDDQTAQNKLVEGIEDEYIKGVSMATAVGRTLRALSKEADDDNA